MYIYIFIYLALRLPSSGSFCNQQSVTARWSHLAVESVTVSSGPSSGAARNCCHERHLAAKNMSWFRLMPSGGDFANYTIHSKFQMNRKRVFMVGFDDWI